MSGIINEPIAALATPEGSASLAVVRLSGVGCRQSVSELCSTVAGELPSLSAALQQTSLHWWADAPPISAWVACFPHGASYTGEESVEIYLPASPPIVRRLLETLSQVGVRAAEPGEFTRRAFLNGRIDLTRAESVAALIDAESVAATQAARRVLSGELAAEVTQLGDHLHDIIALLEAELDFSEQEIDGLSAAGIVELLTPCLQQLGRLLSRSHQVVPSARLRCLLLGRANAGKSSLLNALLGDTRAIVSERAGTTRDPVTARLRWITTEGVEAEVELVDLPGFDGAADAIEGKALELAQRWVEEGDQLLYCVDSTRATTDIEQELAALTTELRQRCWWVQTKCDAENATSVLNDLGNVAMTSAHSGRGVDLLRQRLQQYWRSGSWRSRGASDLVTERQSHALERCQRQLSELAASIDARGDRELVVADLRQAHAELEEITGEICTEATLDRIFSQFCLGK